MNRNAPTLPCKRYPASASKASNRSAPANVESRSRPAPTQRRGAAERGEHGGFALGVHLSLRAKTARWRWACRGRGFGPEWCPKRSKCATIPSPSSKPSNALGNTYIVLMAPNNSPVTKAMALRADCLATMPMVQVRKSRIQRGSKTTQCSQYLASEAQRQFMAHWQRRPPSLIRKPLDERVGVMRLDERFAVDLKRQQPLANVASRPNGCEHATLLGLRSLSVAKTIVA